MKATSVTGRADVASPSLSCWVPSAGGRRSDWAPRRGMACGGSPRARPSDPIDRGLSISAPRRGSACRAAVDRRTEPIEARDGGQHMLLAVFNADAEASRVASRTRDQTKSHLCQILRQLVHFVVLSFWFVLGCHRADHPR